MALPDVLKFVSACKDHLHAEWADFKKTSLVNTVPVCIYSIGGQRDIPAACLESISNGLNELEIVFQDTFDIAVDKETPIISQDIMVCGGGHLKLYPKRKYKMAVLPPPPDATTTTKRRKPQKPPEAFMGGVEQFINYSMDHLKRLSEVCLLSGNIKVLYLVLSSALLIRARVNAYQDALKTATSKGLSAALTRCSEKIELMTQHLLNYHSDLLRSSILHDVPSHDWNSDKPYEENEQISLCIRMWSFHMQALRNDLWRITSPQVGENIFNTIFQDTLGLLVTRYMQIEPSDMRLNHMKADVTAIFLVAASFLPALVTSPHDMFEGEIHESNVFAMHRRLDLLLRVAAIKGASIESLAKVYAHGVFASKHISQNAKDSTKIVSCPDWLTFLNPTFFPANTRSLATLPNNIAIYLTLWNAALRPFPNRSLIIRGLMMRDYLGAKTILMGLQDLPGHVDKPKSCSGVLCLPHLCSSPFLPHTIYSAIVGLIVGCSQSSQILNSLIRSGIKESANWDILDKMQVWNNHRPPWYYALVQLAACHVAVVVAGLLVGLPPHPPAQPAHPSQVSVRLEHHLAAWTQQLINGVEIMADQFPLSLIQISQTINSSLPPTIQPIGGHVMCQIVITALYCIVNSRSSLDQLSPDGAITDGQWDMMVAVGERLCSLHIGNYEKALTQMTDALLSQISGIEDEEDDILDNYTNEEAAEVVCQQLADVASSSLQGQHSFGVIWEYLKRNMEWVRIALNVPCLLRVPSGFEAPSQNLPLMSFAPTPDIYNPLYYHCRTLYTFLNQKHLLNLEGNWEDVLEGDLWLPTEVIKDLISKRPEFRQEAVLTTAEASAVKTLRPYLKKFLTKPSEELEKF